MKKTFKRVVTYVIDGDTFEIDKPIVGITRVRIADVDTPEIGEARYEEMTKYLKKLLLNNKVKLVIKSKNPAKGDYPARWVCYVYYGSFYSRNATEKIQKRLNRASLLNKLFKK